MGIIEDMREGIGLYSTVSMTPIAGYFLLEKIPKKNKNLFFFVLISLLNNFVFSALWSGVAYAVSKHAFKHDMKKNLQMLV